MKAMVSTEYGGPEVLELKELAKPSPADEQVLIKIAYASINSADVKLLRGKPFIARMARGGFSKPKKHILGSDIAGSIEALGAKVTNFKLGDRVCADLSASGLGAFAEYVIVNSKVLSAIPDGISFEQAAALPMAALTAFQAIEKASIKPGDSVLVNGASGGVGSFLVQLAKLKGAKVSAVASGAKLSLLKTLGADTTIDYKKEDIFLHKASYQHIFDAAAFESFKKFTPLLKAKGNYVLVGGSTSKLFACMFQAPWVSIFTGKKYTTVMAEPKKEQLDSMLELLSAGKIKAHVDKTYPLAQLPQAIQDMESRKHSGKLLIEI